MDPVVFGLGNLVVPFKTFTLKLLDTSLFEVHNMKRLLHLTGNDAIISKELPS